MIEGILIVPTRRATALAMSSYLGAVEAIDRHTNYVATPRFERCNKLLGQHGLAQRIDAVNPDTDRMVKMNLGNHVCQLRNDLASAHISFQLTICINGASACCVQLLAPHGSH